MHTSRVNKKRSEDSNRYCWHDNGLRFDRIVELCTQQPWWKLFEENNNIIVKVSGFVAQEMQVKYVDWSRIGCKKKRGKRLLIPRPLVPPLNRVVFLVAVPFNIIVIDNMKQFN